MSTKLVVFTDLDGTLLDKETYSFSAALPALNTLAKRHIPLILNSSKTAAEIAQLRIRLDNQHPFVIENGAAVLVPIGYFDKLEPCKQTLVDQQTTPYLIKRFSQNHQEILSALEEAKVAGFKFSGFTDWSAHELSDICGLDIDSAARAKQRFGTEPILLAGDTVPFEKFLDSFGLRILQGGRFLHVMGQYDKADGVKWLLQAYTDNSAGETITSVALGDSHNDEGMLNCVDKPIIIKSPHSNAITLQRTNDVLHSTLRGASGWNETMQALLKLNLVQ